MIPVLDFKANFRKHAVYRVIYIKNMCSIENEVCMVYSSFQKRSKQLLYISVLGLKSISVYFYDIAQFQTN